MSKREARQELVATLDNYLVDRTTDTPGFLGWVNAAAVGPASLIRALAAFSEHQRDIAVAAMRVIDDAVHYQGEALRRAQTADERREILDRILECVVHARELAEEEASNVPILVGGGLLALLLGVFLGYEASRRREDPAS